MKLYRKLDHKRDNNIHLYSTGILKKYKGMGIMRDAFIETFTHFKNIGYESVLLETSDFSNIDLYKRFQFEMIDQSADEFDRQKIILMKRKLK